MHPTLIHNNISKRDTFINIIYPILCFSRFFLWFGTPIGYLSLVTIAVELYLLVTRIVASRLNKKKLLNNEDYLQKPFLINEFYRIFAKNIAIYAELACGLYVFAEFSYLAIFIGVSLLIVYALDMIYALLSHDSLTRDKSLVRNGLKLAPIGAYMFVFTWIYFDPINLWLAYGLLIYGLASFFIALIYKVVWIRQCIVLAREIGLLAVIVVKFLTH